jgi:hypothetical protein
MSSSELVHRVSTHCRLVLFQATHRPILRDPGEFSFCVAGPPQLPSLPWALDLEDNARAALLEGRLQIMGWTWKWGEGAATWHAAPDTGRMWPAKVFAGIPYRPGNAIGDARVVWEPSRLQHLVTLALIAQEDDAEVRHQAVGLIEAQVCSWVAANPPFAGIHYVSAMECALRLLAACYALDLVRPWLMAPRAVWQSLLTLVDSHAGLIARRISAYSSHGNHTVAEAAGLVHAGILFPELPHADAWCEQGLRLLEEGASVLIDKGGGGREQALWYHWFVADLYGLVVRLPACRQRPIPAIIANAHEEAVTFLNAFGPTQEQSPRIGDGDQGFALSPFLRLSSRPSSPSAVLTTMATGYSLIRTATSPGVTAVFDHGPLGLPPCYAHGHADALSIRLDVAGEEVLADPGTYAYGGEPRWRAYFRGTRAHNTVTVDGLDQAVQETAFLWSGPYRVTLHRRLELAGGTVCVLASHDGYRSRRGVTHWRAVQYRPGGRWLIWDCLTGTGAHDLELHWHIRSPLTVEGDGVVIRAAGQQIGMQVAGGSVSLHVGEADPVRGWYAPAYGVLAPLTTVRAACQAALPHEFVTTLSFETVSGTVSHSPGEPIPDTVLSQFREWVREAEAG